MKVKEIVEILQANGVVSVTVDQLIDKLSNIEIKADAETDIPEAIVKKFSKIYRVDIKPIKAKKPSKAVSEVNKREEAENPVEVKKQAEFTEKKPVEVKKVQKETEKEIRADKVVETSKTKDVVNKNTKNNDEGKVNQSLQNNNPNKKDFKKENKIGKKDHFNEEKDTINELEKQSLYEEKYEDLESDKNKYKRIKNVKKKQNNKQTNDRKSNVPIEKITSEKVLYFTEGLTVARMADSLGRGIGEIVKKLVMLGYMASASDVVDRDAAELIAEDCGFELRNEINSDITKFEEMDIIEKEEDLVERPPIVTIMGHVDHGKTTLLDTIRHSKITSDEAGGITQHIGAYQVRKNGKLITFIDTPGHAAFTEMRARGANITDIVILVVAADDGVMPQTIEAIAHAKAASVPLIVAVNKMDKPSANPDRVMQELANYGVMSEAWGGDVPFVNISALTGMGVEELLEIILLVSEMKNYKANPRRLATGTVIEAKLDKGKGVVVTLLVKNGTLKVGDPIVVGNTWGKIRAMQDEANTNIKVALPSKAVEVTGLTDVPNAGDCFMVFDDEKTARLICEERINRKQDMDNASKPVSLASLFKDSNEKELNLLIKGDVQGSIEALQSSLEKLNVEGVKVNIVRSAVGAITETDISLAIVSKAIIVAFNVRASSKMIELAKEKGIEVRYYDIIYKLLEDIEDAMKGMLDPVFEEKIIGEADVRETYKASKIGTIAGCYVTNGAIERGASVRLIRNDIVVYTGKISSLKRFKEDIKEVRQGFECGLTIENFNDIKVNDRIEAFKMDEVEK